MGDDARDSEVAQLMTRVLMRIAISILLVVGTAGVTLSLVQTVQQADAETPWLWWASRSLGFVAYLSLTLSMIFGVLVSSRGADGLVARKTVLYLHQQWTLAAVISVLLHVAAIVVHSESHISGIDAAVPFAASRLTGPVALGTVAGWGIVLIALSSWFRKRISYVVWRAIHAFAFGSFFLAILHGITAGSDTGIAAQWFYLMSGSAVLAAVMFRVIFAIHGPSRHGRPRPARPTGAASLSSHVPSAGTRTDG